ncbi:MAG: hypothetical protein E7671_04755 [Ruminococcaceae bacterium]|nr:hypothetical protein [Oscillospiraceae bacterium]
MFASKRRGLSVKEISVFAMLGTVLFLGDLLMEWAPNIHFVGALIVVYTLVYRKKALVPIYIYVLMNGLYAGFSLWWMPYLYIWTILWGMTMLLPRGLHFAVATVIYSAVCALHGFIFGALYAPAQAIMFGFDFETTIAWIVAGIPFDIIHGLGDLAVSVIIIPMTALLSRLERVPLPYRIKKRADSI